MTGPASFLFTCPLSPCLHCDWLASSDWLVCRQTGRQRQSIAWGQWAGRWGFIRLVSQHGNAQHGTRVTWLLSAHLTQRALTQGRCVLRSVWESVLVVYFIYLFLALCPCIFCVWFNFPVCQCTCCFLWLSVCACFCVCQSEWASVWEYMYSHLLSYGCVVQWWSGSNFVLLTSIGSWTQNPRTHLSFRCWALALV